VKGDRQTEQKTKTEEKEKRSINKIIKKTKEMLDRFVDSERLLQQCPEGKWENKKYTCFCSLHRVVSGGGTIGSFGVGWGDPSKNISTNSVTPSIFLWPALQKR